MRKKLRRTKMEATKDLIERFQAMYLTKIGESIDYSEAEHQLKLLAELVRLTSKLGSSK
jgi:hypothetical protein